MESVRVRYRRADGEFVDSTLERVTVRELADGLPVREFRWFKGRRHYSGWYWSATVERLVAYESLLELDRILLADHDCEVTAIAAQPFQLIGPDRERTRRHVPDLLLLTRDGGVSVVDVKAASRLDDPTVVAVFAWTRALVGQRGWGFEVWSGAHRYVVDNVRFLAGYRRSTLIAAELIPTVLVRLWDEARCERSKLRCRTGIRRCWYDPLCCICCGPEGCGRTCRDHCRWTLRCAVARWLVDDRADAGARAGHTTGLRR